MRIPSDKIHEWLNDYYDLLKNNPEIIHSERITKEEYIAHCGAMWGYTQGILAMQSVYQMDPDWQ
jgi:hypothetical protein